MSQRNTGPTANTGREQNTTVGVLAHVIALLSGVLGAAVVYLIASDEFGKRNAANALNWQLFLLAAWIGLIILMILALGIIGELAFVLAIPLVLLSILDPIFCIIAAVKASDGNAWTYPLAPNLL